MKLTWRKRVSLWLVTLRGDRRGGIAIVFAFSCVMLMAAMGAGTDLMRAYVDQQKLTEVAALACQYATRPSVVLTAYSSYAGSGSLGSFKANVQTFVTATLHSQFTSVSPSYNLTPTLSGTPGATFSVGLTSSVTTTVMAVVGYTTMSIAATSTCHASTVLPQVNNNNTLLTETFSSSSIPNGLHYIKPNGAYGSVNGTAGNIALTTTFPSTPGFVGTNGTQWYIMGYCLEIDTAAVLTGGQGQINYYAPGGGQNSAELDCDNGNGTKGNSSISTQIYLEAGNYELRYYYVGRVGYPNYDPVYICGSAAADVSWANDLQTGPYSGGGLTGTSIYATSTAVGASSLRTNQVNVYLDLPLSNGTPPTHTTLVDGETLAGSSLIDVCVYSPSNGTGNADKGVWVQRSVRIYVTTAAYYWLSFAADGADDSYGGSIDDIALCQGTCPGTVQDNFPSPSYNTYYPGGSVNPTSSSRLPDWLNPNGMNEGLFTNTFALPAYNSVNGGGRTNAQDEANGNSMKGSAGSTASGWPAQSANGFYTVPINQTFAILSGGTDGGQYIEVGGDVYNSYSSNRLTGTPLLLVPGFYHMSYYYQADLLFSTVVTATYCGATPALANLSTNYGSGTGTIRFTSTSETAPYTSGAIGVFIANAQIVSTPDSHGVSPFGTSSYTNPDSNLAETPTVTSTSATASVPPDAINLTNYTVSTTSALLDICAYAPSWVARSANFKIQKTGIYWLMFSNQIGGTQSSGVGGGIDGVVVTALGSPGMASPPFNPVVVPIGDPQSGASLTPSSSAGYYVVADPLTFPAAMQ